MRTIAAGGASRRGLDLPKVKQYPKVPRNIRHKPISLPPMRPIKR